MPLGSLGSLGNFDNGNVVTPVPSVVAATTIAPTTLVTLVTGTTAIATITPPNPYFRGPLWLISTDASPFTTVTTGNIALATTVVRYKALALVYVPANAKWYPIY